MRNFYLCLLLLFSVLICAAENVTAADETFPITVNYSGAVSFETITVDFCDDWFLRPDDQYNHKLAQASFGMAVTAFRSQVYDIPDQDHDILDFYEKAGFTEPVSNDYDRVPTINTIAMVIAHKQIGDETLIATAISGNNYKNEWLSNFTIDNNVRPAGFDKAAQKVMQRIDNYIETHHLSGSLRLWVTGYSRSAAVANLFAADAVKSGKFQALYAYTFATPRTTREADPHRFHNIFNIINPEDIVPMTPFPEWGYERYGTDLFIPAISTDSGYNEKYIDGLEAGVFLDDDAPIFNPRLRREIHTLFDYIAFFVNSSDTYTRDVQNILIDFYETKDVRVLIREIAQEISPGGIVQSFIRERTRFLHNLYEISNFFNLIAEIIFRSFIANHLEAGNDYDYWNRDISILENIAFGHLEKTYRSWLFFPADPAEIVAEDANYFHYSILGEVYVEIFDENGDFVEALDENSDFHYLTENVRYPDFHGKLSDVLIYGERDGDLTFLVFPDDQVFSIYIISLEDQDIRIACAEYSSEKLMADVKYVFYDHYDEGEDYLETFDPKREAMTAADIPEDFTDVRLVELWSKDVSYSPTAVMRLVNPDPYLGTTAAVVGIFLLLINGVLTTILLLIIKLTRPAVVFLRKKITGKDTPLRNDPLELPEAKRRAAGSQQPG